VMGRRVLDVLADRLEERGFKASETQGGGILVMPKGRPKFTRQQMGIILKVVDRYAGTRVHFGKILVTKPKTRRNSK